MIHIIKTNHLICILVYSTQSQIKTIFPSSFINNLIRMTSPKKSLQLQKQSTLFGQLSHIEQVIRMSKQLINDIQILKGLNVDLLGIQKQGKHAAEQTRVKMGVDVHIFEEKIKNYIVAQKAEYVRLASQINQIVISHKDINNQLQVLNNRVQEYQKNVGI